MHGRVCLGPCKASVWRLSQQRRIMWICSEKCLLPNWCSMHAVCVLSSARFDRGGCVHVKNVPPHAHGRCMHPALHSRGAA